MKRTFKIGIMIVAISLFLSVLTGCDFWNNISKQLGGDEVDYTLTNGYTYKDNDGTTKVSVIRNGEENGFKYILYSNHVEITGYTGLETDVEIPTEIEGTPVTAIGKNAFEKTNITSVKMPDTLIEICDYAFYEAKSLLEVTLGENVQRVGKSAFFGCSSLGAVYLNDTLKIIDEYAFNSCSLLESIVITDSVEKIGTHAFYMCTSMYKVFLPGSVRELGEDVFVRCHQNFKIYAPLSSSAHNYALTNSVMYIECYTYLEQAYNEDTNDTDVSYGDDEHDHGGEGEESPGVSQTPEQ